MAQLLAWAHLQPESQELMAIWLSGLAFFIIIPFGIEILCE